MTEIEQIKQALTNATPAPWSITCTSPHLRLISGSSGEQWDFVARDVDGDGNAELIANAPEWLDYLITTIEFLQGENANEIRIQVKNFQEYQRKLTEKDDLIDSQKKEIRALKEEAFKTMEYHKHNINLQKNEIESQKEEIEKLKDRLDNQLFIGANSETKLIQKIESLQKELEDLKVAYEKVKCMFLEM